MEQECGERQSVDHGGGEAGRDSGIRHLPKPSPCRLPFELLVHSLRNFPEFHFADHAVRGRSSPDYLMWRWEKTGSCYGHCREVQWPLCGLEGSPGRNQPQPHSSIMIRTHSSPNC